MFGIYPLPLPLPMLTVYTKNYSTHVIFLVPKNYRNKKCTARKNTVQHVSCSLFDIDG